jgi:transcriptional regulator with XRE-family HTH domain
MNEYEILGEKIRQERVLKKITQEKLGKSINLSKQAISLIERGKRKVTAIELKKIVDFLNGDIRLYLPPEEFSKFSKMDKDKRWKIKIVNEYEDGEEFVVGEKSFSINDVGINRTTPEGFVQEEPKGKKELDESSSDVIKFLKESGLKEKEIFELISKINNLTKEKK